MVTSDDPRTRGDVAVGAALDLGIPLISGLVAFVEPAFGAALAASSIGLTRVGLQKYLGVRAAEWNRDVTAVVRERVPQERIDGLPNDESFKTTMIQATRAALETHEREKLDALRNAVLNAALDSESLDDERLYFLRLVRDLNGIHLRTLSYLAAPREFMSRTGGDVDDGCATVQTGDGVNYAVYRGASIGLPGLLDDLDLYLRAADDLLRLGLIRTDDDISEMLGGRTMVGRMFSGDRARASTIGARFLAFVSDPRAGQ